MYYYKGYESQEITCTTTKEQYFHFDSRNNLVVQNEPHCTDNQNLFV